MSFLPVYFYFIALSFIVSLIVYSSPGHSYLKIFPPFLLATLAAEFAGSYLMYIHEPNTFIYNFFTAIEFVFYMFLVSLIIKNGKVKKIIRWCSLLYAIVSIGNILFFQGMEKFHTVTYSLGCLVIVIICIYYFLEIFSSPRSMKLSTDPAFWICSGLLFFYCCGFPLYAFLNFWAGFRWMRKSFTDIVDILNIFLYSLFIISFLCSRTRKYISLSS
jgi:hypothetical protein